MEKEGAWEGVVPAAQADTTMYDVTNNCSPAGSEAGGDDEIETGSEGAESTSSSTASKFPT